MAIEDLPVLALDVDGVLLDYLGGFVPWLKEQGHHVTKEAHEVDDWDLSNILPHCDVKQTVELIGQFSMSEQFGRLTPLPGAQSAVAQLRKEFPDLSIVAITSAGTSQETERLRRANLALHSFELDEVTVLPLGGDKRTNLAALPKHSVFVDDLMKNIHVAESVGMPSILYRQPYNAQDDHHLTAFDWSEAIHLVRGLLHVPHRVLRGASRAPGFVASA